MKTTTKAFLASFLATFFVASIILFTPFKTLNVYGQEISPSPTPWAHLTFRTCLIPDTTTFRLSYRADYFSGEYRVVGQNSGYILNLGYLEVNQTGGGFGEDNTTYILPYEDTWVKQWYDGTRWYRAGGLPVTSAADHIEKGLICEVGAHTPYVSPSPTPVTETLTQINAIGGINDNTSTPTASPQSPSSPLPTSTPTVLSEAKSDNSSSEVGIGGTYSDVLGVSSMADTGTAKTFANILIFVFGLISTLVGIRRLKYLS